MYTGDDLPAERRAVPKAPTAYKGGPKCIYNGEDLPVPSSSPESMRRLSERLARLVQGPPPETLDMLPGFATAADGGGDAASAAAAAADWSEDAKWRRWEHGQKGFDAARRQEASDRVVANKATSAYGERLPPRAKGELLPPWAPR